MAIAIATRGTVYHNTANTGAQSVTDGGTPAAGKLLVFCICNAGNANFATAVSGYGLTWELVGQFGWNAARSIEMYAAFSTGATSTAPSSTYAASTGRHMVIMEVTGVVITRGSALNCFRQQTPGVYHTAFNQAAGTSISWAVAAPLNAANRHLGICEHVANEASTAQANYTAIDNTTGFITPSSTVIMEQSNDGARTTCGASWVTTSANGGLVVEIMASVPSLVMPSPLREVNHLLVR